MKSEAKSVANVESNLFIYQILNESLIKLNGNDELLKSAVINHVKITQKWRKYNIFSLNKKF